MGLGTGINCFTQGVILAFGKFRRFIFIPALVSLAIISLGLASAFSLVKDLSDLLSDLGTWPAVIDWIIEPLLYAVSLLMGAWLFGFVATIAGSPFYSLLSARVDPVSRDREPSWYEEIIPALQREWRKARYTLPRLVGLFLLGFVPVINLIAPFLWLVYGGWLMAVQFGDFSFENRSQPFERTLEALRPHRGACIGFGILTTLAMAIPLLNFVIAPVAVVGSALLVQNVRAKTA